MPDQVEWRQPRAPRRVNRPLWLGLGLSATVAAAPWVGLALGVSAAPTVAGVVASLGAIGAGVVVARMYRGNPWRNFVPSPGVTFTPEDPELGSVLGGELEFPGHTFRNVVRGRKGGMDWLCMDVEGPSGFQRLLIADLRGEVPPLAAYQSTQNRGPRATRDELAMPGLVVGRTGAYLFPADEGINDPHYLTSIMSPSLTEALRAATFPRWRTTGHYLVASVGQFAFLPVTMARLDVLVSQLIALANALPTTDERADEPDGWPLL